LTRYTLIQISDLHLSRRRAYTYANWRAVSAYIEATRPALVVNTGDFVLDTPEDHDDLTFAHAEMSRLTVPWRALPGDHDIGGSPPLPRPRPDVPWLERYLATQERLDRYLALFGEDCWAQPFGDWMLIGINALVFETGLAGAAAQWEFLDASLRAADRRPVALFTHKPPCALSMDETTETTQALPTKSRRRLRELMARHNIRLFACGHRHIYRTFQTAGAVVVCAPTLMGDGDARWTTDGIARNGVVEYSFEGEAVSFRLIEPPGVVALDLPATARHAWPPLAPGESL
jgi:3',5'-cyclic AMP phosphodiesterase CpdA